MTYIDESAFTGTATYHLSWQSPTSWSLTTLEHSDPREVGDQEGVEGDAQSFYFASSGDSVSAPTSGRTVPDEWLLGPPPTIMAWKPKAELTDFGADQVRIEIVDSRDCGDFERAPVRPTGCDSSTVVPDKTVYLFDRASGVPIAYIYEIDGEVIRSVRATEFDLTSTGS